MNIANTDQPISISDLYQQLQVIPTRFSLKPHQIIQLVEQIEIQILARTANPHISEQCLLDT